RAHRGGLQRAARALGARRRLPCAVAADLQAELSLRRTGPGDPGRQAAVQGRRRRGRDSRPWALRGVLRAYRRRRPEPASACQSSGLLGDGVLVSAEDATGDAETRALVKRLAHGLTPPAGTSSSAWRSRVRRLRGGDGLDR